MAATAIPLGKAQEDGNRSVLAEVYRDLLACTADHAFIALHHDGKIASWSRGAEHLFGLPADRAIGEDFACLYSKDAVSEGAPARDLATALEVGTTISSGRCLSRGSGAAFQANIHLSAIFDAQGRHLGFLELVHSAGTPKLPRHYVNTLAEADLVLSSVHDAIYVQDLAGNMLYANDAAARIFAFQDGQEFVKAPLAEATTRLEVFDESGQELDPYALMSSCGGGRDLGEAGLFYSRTRSTNESRWVLVRQARICDERGHAELVVTVATDVTDSVRSKHSERALSETTKLLSASLDYETTLRNLTEALVPDLADWATVVCVEDDVPRKVAFASRDTELAGRIRDSWATTGEDFTLSSSLAEVLRTGRPALYESVTPELMETFATTPAELAVVGQNRVRSLIVAPIVVGERTDGVLVTGRFESKRQYDRGDLDLVSEIGRRAGTAIEHTRLYRDAQHAVRLRNEFLAVAAHELRTPLAALTLQLQSLRIIAADLHCDPKSEEKVGRLRERVDKTVRQSNRLTRLVDSLLDVSQIAGGRLELHRSDVNLCALVSSVCERFVDEAERTGSALVFSGDGSCNGSWDADRLDQVVANILSNVIKYGKRKPIEVHCSCDRNRACVTVTDHGIGIAPENLARIFGRFERAVPEQNYGGLGLGLWIAQEIAEAHGGRVEVESTLGHGAVFRLFLPLRHSKMPPPLAS